MEKKKEASRGSICRRMRTTMIIVHCTATPEGRDIGMKEIRQWHVCGQGWADVGYHYLVRLDGTIESGREEHLAGAHCKGKNNCSVGVCYVGGCTADGRTAKDTHARAEDGTAHTHQPTAAALPARHGTRTP
ncbi:MAG: N-acetylmuramoyl-L-alanine amidase [Prevotella sp.]